MAEVIGYIGVGDMGGPMARNLLKAGFEVVVFDLQSDRLDALVNAGARRADSALDVANRASTVMVCLNTIDAGHAVAQSVAAGGAVRTYIDLSTTGPTTARELRSCFEGTGVAMLDAPVSGRIEKAADGTLTVMASGPRAAFDTAMPAFKAIGENIFYLGETPGGGQMMKLANNYLNNVQGVATAEALTMGLKFGLDAKTMFDIWNVSTGRNTQTETKMREAVLSGAFAGGANMKIGYKDISLAVEEAQRLGAPTDLGTIVRDVYSEALANGGDKERSSAIAKHVAAKGGVRL